MASNSALVTVTRAMPMVTPGPVAPLAEAAAEALRARSHTVAVFESTTGGLIQAALQAVPGASVYTTCGAVTYHSSRAVAVLGSDMSAPRASTGEGYVNAKKQLTARIARRMRGEVGAQWCISESGACGPTFNVTDISTGFTVITVTGPIERSVLVESTHARREDNMWGFAKAALDLLLECVESTPMSSAPDEVSASSADSALLCAQEDRYGGVEIEVPESARSTGPLSFQHSLRRRIQLWVAAGKRGLWLKLPLACSHFVGMACDEGFSFHHAQPGYVLLTRWLPPDMPSPLPSYAFTQIGVGGVVVNTAGEVLMVKERVSPVPLFQGCWKLPGGLADPGEDFADTVAREVREETGIVAELGGVVSMRHSHGFRFGQGDLYVLVKMLAKDSTITLDTHELLDATWMTPEQIKALVAAPDEPLDGRVSHNNWKMIDNALHGALIVGCPLANSRGPRASMLYTAAASQAHGPALSLL